MGTKIKAQNMLSIQTGMQQLLVQQCRELLRPFVRSLTFDRFQTFGIQLTTTRNIMQ